jgi:hypothetical protein
MSLPVERRNQQTSYGAAAAAPERAPDVLAERVDGVAKRVSLYVRCKVEVCRQKMLKVAERRCDCMKVVCSMHQFDHGCTFVFVRRGSEVKVSDKKAYQSEYGGAPAPDCTY